ncbi:hypothetical protein LEA_08724 [human gut metagenome]|uniref:Wadjet protein JetD C-terminal domain-containing protein n=1 Tax=human gut metagenome TaxID=408170 RepID=K1T684_9ZZZZ
MEVAEGEIQYFHWGDMDMGGIRIFRFNKKNIFPKLKPYKMDREAFQEALERGAGIPLEEKKKEKLEKLNAGELEELKKCILEKRSRNRTGNFIGGKCDSGKIEKSAEKCRGNDKICK